MGKPLRFSAVLLLPLSLSLPAFLHLCSLCCIIPRPLSSVIMIICCPPLCLLCIGHPLSLFPYICLKTHTHTLSFCSLPQEFHAWLAKGGAGGCPDAFPQWLLDPGYFGIAYLNITFNMSAVYSMCIVTTMHFCLFLLFLNNSRQHSIHAVFIKDTLFLFVSHRLCLEQCTSIILYFYCFWGL